jgi:hypothetical protein
MVRGANVSIAVIDPEIDVTAGPVAARQNSSGRRAGRAPPCRYRVFPPTSRHLPSALAVRFLGRGVGSIDRDGAALQAKAGALETQPKAAQAAIISRRASQDAE